MKKRVKTKLIVLLLSSLLLITLTPSIFITVEAIKNGQPDGDDHPYVCIIVFDIYVPDVGNVPAWRGSGVAISPTVILTAGHATDGAVAARVWFDESIEGNPDYPDGGLSAIEGTPYTHPGYYSSSDRGLAGLNWQDVGVVVLDTPISLPEYAELPNPGIVDTLGPGTIVDQVGYGVKEQVHGGGQPYWTGERSRYYAPAEIIPSNDILTDDFIKTTANPGKGKGGTCFGDSGGPVLLEGTDIILGLTSWGRNNNCAGISYAARVDTEIVLQWIIEEEYLD